MPYIHNFKLFLVFSIVSQVFGFILSPRRLASRLPVYAGPYFKEDLLACPESLDPLKLSTKFYGLVEEKVLETEGSERKYKYTGTYYDLTPSIASSDKQFRFNIREAIGQNFFQNPIISGIYERGYRQNFERAGFPGIDKEFAEVDELFSAINASRVLDVSCGPGFMSRKLVASRRYSEVVAADLSPNMLGETKQRFLNEDLPLPLLIRCDVASLPFASECFDAVHAGAALHCWPKLSQSLREVFRVLKPGGVFYASTFFLTVPITKFQRENSGFYYFENEAEIKGFLEEAGFSGDSGSVVVRKEGRGCAIVKAVKGQGIPESLTNIFNNAK